jgi:Flp pilus assembly protein TadG
VGLPLRHARSAARRCAALTAGLGRRLRGHAHALRGDRAGNTTIIFAIAVIPIFGSVGAAIDYSRANNARTAMQAALDATALTISKQALDLKSTQVQTKARTYFKAMFNRPDVKGLKVTSSLQVNALGDFTVLADGSGTTSFDRHQPERRPAVEIAQPRASPAPSFPSITRRG